MSILNRLDFILHLFTPSDGFWLCDRLDRGMVGRLR